MSTLEKDLAKARATVADWEKKAEAAHDEAVRLDREADQQILNDPSAAERVEVKVQAKRRTARALDAAAEKARAGIDEVLRKHVEAEHKRLVKAAAAARKAADDHDRKVARLLEQLRDLDGTAYEPVFGRMPRVEDGVYHPAVEGALRTTGDQLEDEAVTLEAQAGAVAFYLEHGRMPTGGDSPRMYGPHDPMYSVSAPAVLAEVIAAKAAA